MSRRTALQLLGGAAIAGGVALAGLVPQVGRAQSAEAALGMPLADEKVADTLKRLFGGRPIQPAGDKVKFEAPLIAENGAVVPVRIEAELPMTREDYVRNIYIIADKNRRPLNAQFTLTPEAGKAVVGTNIRLASTTDVRAIVETSKGALYEAKREVKVTVGGCGG
jgi:sulfur-oxidizing protein SoxY